MNHMRAEDSHNWSIHQTTERIKVWVSCQNLHLFPVPAMLNPRRQIFTARECVFLHPPCGRLFREKLRWTILHVNTVGVDCLFLRHL